RGGCDARTSLGVAARASRAGRDLHAPRMRSLRECLSQLFDSTITPPKEATHMRRHISDRPRGWVIAPWIVLLLLCASTAFAQQPAATREISGTVTDIDGKPIANATVAVAGGGVTATTAAD